jgi:indole-3-glycerol phosphate synthase
MILDHIARYTKERVEKLKQNRDLDQVKADAARAEERVPFAFENALKNKEIAFICEVKKASPSLGVISETFPYKMIAAEYEEAGASALSVLTEPGFFLGCDSHLEEIRKRVNLPILRKDFIVDSYQIYESKAIGADAILLICALLDLPTLREYLNIADSLGLSALVETHTEEEVKMAIASGARVIGINNRDLQTFAVDLNVTLRLRKLVPAGILIVSESGIRTRQDIELLLHYKIDAVLIGETLMKSGSRSETMNMLRYGGPDPRQGMIHEDCGGGDSID